MSVTPNAGCVDVVIVGAGISDRARPTGSSNATRS